jgi:cytochrome c553
MMEAGQVLSKKQLRTSPMPSPKQMQLSEQDVADITAFLLGDNKAITSR